LNLARRKYDAAWIRKLKPWIRPNDSLDPSRIFRNFLTRGLCWSKYFHLVYNADIRIYLWLDNEIDRKIDVTAMQFLLVQNRQQTHDWTQIGSGANGLGIQEWCRFFADNPILSACSTSQSTFTINQLSR